MKPLLILLTGLLLSSCSKLVPLNYHTRYNPHTVAVNLNDSAELYLEHLYNKYQHLVFDLEIRNRSHDYLQFSPETINLYASDKPFPPVEDPFADVYQLSASYSTLPGGRFFAISPIEVRHLHEKRMKAKAAVGTLFFAMSVGLAIYDAVEDGKDYNKESFTREDARKSAVRDGLVATTFFAADITRNSLYNDEVEYSFLREETFPDCVIESRHSVRGKIYIKPGEYVHNYYRIIVPLKNVDYVFDLRRKGARDPAKRTGILRSSQNGWAKDEY